MSQYTFSCTIEGLHKQPRTLLLEQAGCRVSDENVEFDLTRYIHESSDTFRERGRRWIARELARVNALTEASLTADSVRADPSPGSTTIRIGTAWGHMPQLPSRHAGWEDPSVEFRLLAWEQASKTEDASLLFLTLDCICESAGVPQSWPADAPWPPRFAEVRIIRNLLVHGHEQPNNDVLRYLESRSPPVRSSRYRDRHQHLEMARYRAAHLKAAVWKIVVNDCVDTEVDLLVDTQAGSGGAIVVDNGPCPVFQPERD